MDSFLSRLAGRTLGLVAVAEPIIPARLTPDTRDHVRPRPIPAGPPVPGEGDPTPVHPSAETVEAQRPSPIRLRLDPVIEGVSRTQEEPRSTANREPLPKTPRSVSAPQSVDQPREHPAPAVEKADARPASVPIETAPAPAKPFMPSPPIHARMYENRARVQDAEAVRDEVPRIHVSIGRIEIRAEVEAAQAPVPRRSRPATLSLSDYLRQQSEVRR